MAVVPPKSSAKEAATIVKMTRDIVKMSFIMVLKKLGLK